jgi:hypothetical protein
MITITNDLKGEQEGLVSRAMCVEMLALNDLLGQAWGTP